MFLVLNCGSQSIKWKLFSDDLVPGKEAGIRILEKKSYKSVLLSELRKIAEENSKIMTIGHRVVHAGGKFTSPLVIDKQNLKELEKISDLAPLHNPYNLLGIKISQKVFKSAKQVAVFDTAFYDNLPEKASTYALPEYIREKYNIKRFGFHGTSHEYAANEAAKAFSSPIEELQIISCHLGGGASITAINEGKAVDTSMGFTPLEGVVMMTRTGNLDPGIVLKLQKKEKNLDYILNNESGMKALCGISDMLEVLTAIDNGDEKAKKALDIYVYNIQKYIGAYFAILNGCDILVFTGSIGYGSERIRKMICAMDILEGTKIMPIKADEELAIAQKLLNK